MKLSRWLLVALTLWSVGCKRSSPAPSPVAAVAPSAPSAQPVALSAAVTAPRPEGGESFGLYLLDKKIGFLFTQLAFENGRTDRVVATSQTVLKTNLGGRLSERRHLEKRTYEAKAGGRLLAFVIEMSGDGGNQMLEGLRQEEGMRVLRRRPGAPEETLQLPLPRETVEDADQVRVALKTQADVSGFTLHPMDLETYGLRTTLAGEETRTRGGIRQVLKKVVSVSEKEKVPTEALVDAAGRIVEIRFGPNMRALAEPRETAESLEHVEVFSLTRVTLPRPLPPSVKDIPGSATFVMKGLPEKFQVESARQKFRKLDEERVEVTLLGKPPGKGGKRFPLACPKGGEYLKHTLIVEADNPAIQKRAREILGQEKDALAATRKINAWVYQNVKKDYGASSDRATDVLRHLRGDCTEHSLLMVALLRSVGIPARRTDGLIYMVNSDGVPAFYWHEWVEAWVGEWTQLDPTFGQPVADATHFALGEETAAEITPLLGQLAIVDVR